MISTNSPTSENLEKLLVVSGILNESIDKKTVLQKIADTAVEFTQMESSAIYLVENDRLYMSATFPALDESHPDEFRKAEMDHHWHIKKTVQANELCFVTDSSAEKFSEQEALIVAIVGLKTILYLPLNHENKVIGVLILGTLSHIHQFSDSEISFFKTFANLSSTALANAKLFDENRQYTNQLKLLSRAVESSSVTVVVTDANGKISYVNPYFTNLTGYSFDEVVGENPRILQSGNQPAVFYKEMWDKLLAGDDWTGEFQNKKKNGELYWERATISPILNKEGEITNFVAIKEDITDRKQILEELIAAKEKAEESDQLKTAFLNNISHEIRTPLNGILGFGQIIAETELSVEERKDFFKLLEKSSHRLMDTMTDYMDMAKLVSNTLKVTMKEFNLLVVLETMATKASKMCAEKNIEFIPHFPDESAVVTLKSDPEFIIKILDKLLDNAIKFTSEGCVTIDCSINGEQIMVVVSDTGIGIENDRLELIFDAFRQADNALSRTYEGSGLGLTIAKKMVTLLGGTISVVSAKGKGSTFTVTIPVEQQSGRSSSAAEQLQGQLQSNQALVLIAEDDECNYEYLEIIMHSIGYHPLHAVNGQEAVDMCREHPDISLVLMDIKMPVMNGVEATKQIRQFRPQLPIVAITAHALTGDETRILAAGCNDYLSKPVLKKELLTVIARHI